MKKRAFIITGGANGIGRAIVASVVAQGDMALVIDTDELSGAMLEKRYAPDAFRFFKGDISEKRVLEEFVGWAVEAAGKIHALVNNACFSLGGLTDCSYEDFEKVLRVGVTAPFYLTKLLIPHFAPGASVINIASTRAFMSQPDTESYSAAKGGIAALTHAMSASLAGRVRVNAISPGWRSIPAPGSMKRITRRSTPRATSGSTPPGEWADPRTSPRWLHTYAPIRPNLYAART